MYIYTYIHVYIYTHVHMYRRFRGASSVYPTPRNREIGFVSSSFSFRAVRAVRAGEAKLCGRMWDVVLIAGPPGC